MAGFTKQQIQSLDALLNKHLDILFDRIQDEFLQRSSAPPSAPPPALPAPQACASTPPELPPQRPPQPTCPLPPANPPSVKILQEVEHKYIWNHRASKAVPTIRVARSENCIGRPPKLGGIYICFSRDEEPDAWYTTMLNHKHKLATGAMLHPA